MSSISHVPLWGTALLCVACAAQKPPSTTPNRVVEMEALRIVAKHDEQGGYSFESYNAEELFTRANAALDAGKCGDAVGYYEKLIQEFPTSRYHSASLYNAGLCLAHLGQKDAALARFERLLKELPDSPDVKHATFQAGHLSVDLSHWDGALSWAEALLARDDLDAAERVEAMSMRAQALLGKGRIENAHEQAEQALSYYRTRAAELTDPYYVAAANFVLAEALRLRGESMAFPDSNQEAQKAVLVKRAQILLDAQRAYFDTIRHTNPHWAAAAGHRIGAMYDTLWHDLMDAPVPATLSPGARELYPQELAKLIKPLLRHAIRYWELTLMMVERTGVQTEWAEKTRNDLERTKKLLLEQPPGPGGLPEKRTSTPSSDRQTAPSP